MVEFLEHAIDNDLVRLEEVGDLDDIDFSGLEGWEDDIERFKNSRTVEEIIADMQGEEMDILEQINSQLDGEGNIGRP